MMHVIKVYGICLGPTGDRDEDKLISHRNENCCEYAKNALQHGIGGLDDYNCFNRKDVEGIEVALVEKGKANYCYNVTYKCEDKAKLEKLGAYYTDGNMCDIA